MRTQLHRTLPALVCTLTLLALPTALLLTAQSFAQNKGDDTNAARIGFSLWADMYQVMSGTSPTGTPGEPQHKNLKINTPKGIYAFVPVDMLVTDVTDAMKNSGVDSRTAWKNYFAFLLSQPEVAGIQFGAPWSLLGGNDPATPDWTALDAAFDAVSTAGKTLQLAVSPGFGSPTWLFDHLTPSCDFLFEKMNPPTDRSCGYTTIFEQKEVPNPGYQKLPLPWNTTYHRMWRAFLQSLWSHIGDNNWKRYVVSVGVGGPTATTTEIILPNANVNAQPHPLVLPSGTTNPDVNALSAWNCLLANNYGLDSPYLDSDRAFIEEWANAIDMYGEIFSGVTLIVTTGNGLPNFKESPYPQKLQFTNLSGCGLKSRITLPDSSSPSYKKLSEPHPAFKPDCGSAPKLPMDCAAEAAILAYFAEPSVGGPNAKATNEAALSINDNVASTLLSLSNASVKWLSQVTAPGLETMEGVSGAASFGPPFPVVSRVMGGLQLQHTATKFVSLTKTPPGTIMGTKIGCSSLPCSAEQSLQNVLQVFFGGTSKAGVFGASTTIKNNDTPVKNAPMNYLQIWAEDIQNVAGFGNCSVSTIMATPSAWTKLSCYHSDASTTAAQKKLALAGKNIPTDDPVDLPLFGYNPVFLPSGGKSGCTLKCVDGYVQRQAFDGDLVCVLQLYKSDAKAQNEAYKSTYATDSTISATNPYGVCKSNHAWRQTYMGDYVCVAPLDYTEAFVGNATGPTLTQCR